MKKLVAISLFIFWAVTAAILTAGLVFYQNNSSLPDNPSGINDLSGQNPGLTLDVAEIAKHDSINDCWLIINSKIYNVTKYLGEHPGGAAVIIPFCGRDATQAYGTKDGSGNPHSNYANDLLSSYYIGDLNQSVGTAQIQNTDNAPPPTTGKKQKYEEEDD